MKFDRILLASTLAALALLSPAAIAQSDDPMSDEPTPHTPPTRPNQDDRPRPDRAGRLGGGLPGGRELSLEQAKPVWELQAQSVSRDIKLDPALTPQVTEWYIQTRHDLRIALGKLREEMREQFQNQRPGAGGGRGGRPGRGGDDGEISFRPPPSAPPSDDNLLGGEPPAVAHPAPPDDLDDIAPPGPPGPPARPFGGGAWLERTQAVTAEHREALKAKLATILTGQQLERAMLTLGSFDPRFDQFVFALASFNLEPSAQDAAIDAVRDNVAMLAEVRKGGEGGAEDRDVIRTAEREAAKQLEAVLKAVLTEEQMTRIQRMLQPGQGRVGGGGPEGERPGRFNSPRARAPGMKERLMAFDADGDDKVQLEEMPERMQQSFHEWDANEDGVLDPEEIEALAKELEERFERGGRGDRGSVRPGDEL